MERLKKFGLTILREKKKKKKKKNEPWSNGNFQNDRISNDDRHFFNIFPQTGNLPSRQISKMKYNQLEVGGGAE